VSASSAAAHGDRQHANPNIDPDGEKLGVPDPERRNQHEASGHRPDHGAERVDAVEPGQPCPEVTVAIDESAGKNGERGAHQQRRKQQDSEGQGRADHVEPRRHAVGRERRAHVETVRQGEKPRQCQGEAGDSHLEKSVDAKRPGDALADPPEQESAEAQSRHERGQKDARRLEARAEDQREVPQPGHLVHKSCGAREEKEPVDQDPCLPDHVVSHARWNERPVLNEQQNAFEHSALVRSREER
jgi:hypothetical protein